MSLLISLPIKGVFHKAKNQPHSDASTLLHAYIWVRFCSLETELESLHPDVICNNMQCTVIWSIFFHQCTFNLLDVALSKMREIAHMVVLKEVAA